MNTGRIGVGLAAIVLAVSGCADSAAPTPAVSPSGPAASQSSTVPAGPTAKDELVAALDKSRKASFAFTVKSKMAKKGAKYNATGVHDLRARRLKYLVRTDRAHHTAGTGYIATMLLGTHSYERYRPDDTWIHLDMTRLAADSYFVMDLKDPTGLGLFTTRVGEGEVRRTGPRTYAGTFDAQQVGLAPAHPIGAPYVVTEGSIDWPAGHLHRHHGPGRLDQFDHGEPGHGIRAA